MEDNEVYRLTEWGCLYITLTDYGIDVEHIPGKVGQHIVEDFMDLLVSNGFIENKEVE